MAAPLPILPKSVLGATLPDGRPNTELINYERNQARALQQLQAGGGLPALIAAIANVSPAANEFLRFTGATTVETLTAAQVKTALTIAAGDVSGLGTAAVENTGTSGANVPKLDGANTWSAAQTFAANSITITTAKTPASASDTGTQGQIAWDADFLYVCVATDTWKRVGISTW